MITFEYRFKLNGKERTAYCGKWPAKTLKKIRDERDAKQKMVEAGQDPIELNKAAKLQKQVDQAQIIEQHRAELGRLAAEAANCRTFSAAIAQWEKLELSRRKDGGKEAMRAINKDIIPVLGDVALVDVKRAMIVDILDEVVERGARVMANHLFGNLKQPVGRNSFSVFRRKSLANLLPSNSTIACDKCDNCSILKMTF